jgi:HK97 family phage prohead protease
MEQLRVPALMFARVETTDGGPPVFRFRAVTNKQNRLGYVVSEDGWRLDAFKRNPVFLYSHDYSAAPIGRVTEIAADDEGLLAAVVFDPDDPLAQQIEAKYARGFMHAVSVGFDPVEVEWGQKGEPTRILQQELLEISAVAVPADAGALVLQQLRERFPLAEQVRELGAIGAHTTAKADEGAAWDAGAQVRQADGAAQLRRMHAWVDSSGDPEAKTSYKLPHHMAAGPVVWRGVAAAMSRLMQAGTQIPDSDQAGVYAHLAGHYRQFDKEPPGRQSVALLASLDQTALAAHLGHVAALLELGAPGPASSADDPPPVLEVDLSALIAFTASPSPGWPDVAR